MNTITSQEVQDIFTDNGLYISFSESESTAEHANKNAAANLWGIDSAKQWVEFWIESERQ
ncbi:hypothetical protein GPY51_10890 [Photorhabdus laumondii subsp. laumondii]|uniref:Uncharacterized protein n=2 Tax=Photorhabdus TaxID=29487 RepID=A0ABX0B5G7_9GAMM|nr:MULTISPECIES: hypothetical protein [Photorhabdus]MCC8376420.1 hypothetical protein [Photorhabdus bodei]MCC8384619.1 hypothetical protein [Photorhabdus laumondii]MCC8413335.1 hypothetical protein [Photorhabdus laumondii]MCC8421967.1 hypothetical protein [Photorhabdus thracensis]NDK95001.1 hypothetical protein [Photorhabdus laumondii subsp. laumondii]